MIVAKITPEQAEQLRGIEYKPHCFFNPTIDANNNYVISMVEVENLPLDFVNTMELIEFEPRVIDGESVITG